MPGDFSDYGGDEGTSSSDDFGDDYDNDSDDFGEGGRVGLETRSEIRWPMLRQFCIFLENRVGSLNDLLRTIERHDLRIVALSIVDSADFAVVRLILDDTDRARELFDLSGRNYFENDLIGVLLPDAPQPYLDLCLCLLGAELNIHYTYPLNFRRENRGTIAIHVDDLDQAATVLEEGGHTLISESDLRDGDGY